MSGTRSSRWREKSGNSQSPTYRSMEIEKIVIKNILSSDFTCSICLNTFIEPSVLECKHIFCSKCLKDWLSTRRTCPMCRMIVTKDPVQCPLLGKLIIDMMDTVSTPHTPSRRKTMYCPQRQNLRKENNKRPPWR